MSSNRLPVPTVREVLTAAWRVTRPNLVTITAITLVVYIPIDVALSFVPVSEEKGLLGLKQYFNVQRALEFWLGTIASLAIVHVTSAAGREPRVSISFAFRRAFGSYLSGLGCTFLYNIALILGLLLPVIPGIAVAVYWSSNFLYNLAMVLGLLLLVVPGIAVAVFWAFYFQLVAIHGRPCPEALAESYRFVKGRWWRLFKPIAIVGCLLLVIALFTGGVTAFTPESRVLEVLIGIPASLCSAFSVVCLTQLYLLSGGLERHQEERELGAGEKAA